MQNGSYVEVKMWHQSKLYTLDADTLNYRDS